MLSTVLPYAVLGTALVVARLRGSSAAVIFLVVVGLALFPRTLVTPIPGEGPLALADFSILVVGVTLLVCAPKRLLWQSFTGLGIYVVLLISLDWDNPPVRAESISPLFLAIVAYGAGGFVAQRIIRAPSRARGFLLAIVLIVVAFQFVVSMGQFFGLDWFPSSSDAAQIESGRAAGTLGHPGNLGKVLILIIAIVLPFAGESSKRARVAVYTSIVLGVAATGVSESRTNFIALFGMLFLWIILSRRRGMRGSRFAFVLVLALTGSLSLDSIISRFQADAQGGERSHLLSVALAHIGDNLWFGVGPGNYIEYFGRYDALTSQGWPVHNVFVFVAAEFGLVGAVLMFGPMLFATVRAVRVYVHTKGEGAPRAVALISLSAAIVIVGMTGWGLASGSIMYLWFFGFGYIYASLLAGTRIGIESRVLPASFKGS